MGLGMTVFMAFFFGLIQFCYGLYAYNYVGEAAREASRFAMVRGSTCSADLNSNSFCSPYSGNTGSTGADSTDVTTFVKNLGFPGMQKSNVSVTTNWYIVTSTLNANGTTTHSWSTTACSAGPPTCNTPGNSVQVTVTYPVAVGIPFLGKFNIPVKSTSQMIMVQ
jgi:Flp pilus assembly protein TadG